jgi:hypothetical protein
MAEDRKKKHVIILGAGASVTSGYPMADKLRLLTSSETALRDELAIHGKTNYEHLDKIVREMMGGNLKAVVDLFRHGGFGSVDEFSRLANNRYHREIQGLKRLLRFALSLHDPENNFHKSDYYAFIQRLFINGLFPLRNDIAILTFNYDPYLPYLLAKAHKIRSEAVGHDETANEVDAITSGFSLFNVGALEAANDLCVLQLHGTVAWPIIGQGEQKISTDDLFGKSIEDRIQRLCFSRASISEPPILFPWEIMSDGGTFIDYKGFCLREAPEHGQITPVVQPYHLFVSIWKRAQREITSATKISFVGLSMHEFLNPAFKFLFQDKQNDGVQFVVANKDLSLFPGPKALGNRSSPAAKAGNLLHDVWSKRFDPAGSVGFFPNLRETFEDFIKYEMDQ